MAKPAISVVIPAFNEEKFLPKLLTSLKCQSFSLPYEIIVIDNNSTDKTGSIAKKFGAQVVKEEKQGYAYACNKGFFLAKADIIARADSDYVLPPNWLETIWKAFKKNKKLIAVGGPIYPLEGYWWENIVSYPGLVLWMYLLKALKRGFLFPNIAMKREAFLQTKGFNITVPFGEDVDMCKKLQEQGKVVLNLKMYVHSSTRRIQDMGGLFQFLLKYGIANQIAMWKGKGHFFGLNPVRKLKTNRVPSPSKPWVYLFIPPLSLISIIGIFLFFILK